MNKTSIWTKPFIFIALINFFSFIAYNMIITGIPVYITTLGGTSVIVGLIASLSAFTSMFIRPISGLLIDRLGAKKILLFSMLTITALISGYALFPILAIILGLRITHGIAWGLGSTASSTIASNEVPRNRFAEGMGYFALTTSLSSAFAPTLAVSVMDNMGAKWMFTIAAILTLSAGIMTFSQKGTATVSTTEKSTFNFSNLFEKDAVIPAILMFLVMCAFGSVTSFVVLYGKSLNIDNVSLYFIVYAISSIATRPLIGKLIDRIGNTIPGIISALAVTATLVLLSFTNSITLLCIAGGIAGIGVGTAMGTFQTMAVASVSSERRGVATSTWYLGLDAGTAVGAFLAGVLSDMYGYSKMYLLMSTFALLAAIIIIIKRKQFK